MPLGMRHVGTLWRAILLIAPMVISGCQHHSPDFLSHVEKRCAGGDSGACGLLDAVSHPNPTTDIPTPGNISDDVDAILRGIDRARSAPRVGYPDMLPIAIELPS
jgi:hypothetical protein